MASPFLGLNIAFRSLMAHQQAMEVVSHNVANVNTPGFSRQEPVFCAEGPYTVPEATRSTQAGQVGMGVQVTQIRRLNQNFVSRSIWMENQALGHWEVMRESLQHIEAIMPEPSDGGLSNTLDAFWGAWRDLSADPESMALRAAVSEQGARLADVIRTYSEQIAAYRQELNTQIQTYVQDINDIVKEIAQLNDQIVAVRAVGDQPNDLLDQRDQLVDRLSELCHITYTEEEGGTATILMGGHFLVMRGEAAVLEAVPSVGDPTLLDVEWVDRSVAVAPGGGRLGGILEARDEAISGVLTSLDEIAAALVSEVNAVHRMGYGLDGSTGLDFFEGTSAATICLSDDVADLTRLATAAEDPADPGHATGPGDGAIALAIAQVADRTVLAGGSITISDHYRMMIGRIGLQAAHAEANQDASEAMVAHLRDRRDQVSGVSLDEEASNMIRYQRAYQAAAKMITVVDQMIETLLNMGLVGR